METVLYLWNLKLFALIGGDVVFLLLLMALVGALCWQLSRLKTLRELSAFTVTSEAYDEVAECLKERDARCTELSDELSEQKEMHRLYLLSHDELTERVEVAEERPSAEEFDRLETVCAKHVKTINEQANLLGVQKKECEEMTDLLKTSATKIKELQARIRPRKKKAAR